MRASFSENFASAVVSTFSTESTLSGLASSFMIFWAACVSFVLSPAVQLLGEYLAFATKSGARTSTPSAPSIQLYLNVGK